MVLGIYFSDSEWRQPKSAQLAGCLTAAAGIYYDFQKQERKDKNTTYEGPVVSIHILCNGVWLQKFGDRINTNLVCLHNYIICTDYLPLARNVSQYVRIAKTSCPLGVAWV